MLRLQSATGWWLITHPDHAHLAGAFAEHWGNATFRAPTPREHVLHAIHVHDEGWRARDAQPSITRAGIPAAFSRELVGAYSAFEEIDLADYLAVRERARLRARAAQTSMPPSSSACTPTTCSPTAPTAPPSSPTSSRCSTGSSTASAPARTASAPPSAPTPPSPQPTPPTKPSSTTSVSCKPATTSRS